MLATTKPTKWGALVNWLLSQATELRKAALCIIVAAIGGALGYTLRTLDAGNKISIVRLIVEFLSSGFVGYVVLEVAVAMHLSDGWTGAATGVFGWLGGSVSMRLIAKMASRRIGITDEK